MVGLKVNVGRKGHDGIAYMIACDKCSEWFHGECIGLPKSLVRWRVVVV